MSSAATPPAPLDELAASLQFSITRLARLLRQQDQSGLAPPLATALASIRREGPITMSRLAALEQVRPPTITKIVDRLDQEGFVERRTDPADRRVCRIAITPAGVKKLNSIRTRRTEWLTAQLGALPADDLARLSDAVAVLDDLIAVPEAVRR